MTFAPITGKDIRVKYKPDKRTFDVEQVRIRRLNGATSVEDVASIVDLNQEVWVLRATTVTVDEAVDRCLGLMIKENVQLRSVDFGATGPLSTPVQEAIEKLSRIRL